MRISERRLRRVIRYILMEQVVGYTPPSERKSGDDYEEFGDISTPVSSKVPWTKDPEDREHLDTKEQATTKKRQKDLDRGDAVAADADAETAAKLRQSTG